MPQKAPCKVDAMMEREWSYGCSNRLDMDPRHHPMGCTDGHECLVVKLVTENRPEHLEYATGYLIVREQCGLILLLELLKSKNVQVKCCT